MTASRVSTVKSTPSVPPLHSINMISAKALLAGPALLCRISTGRLFERRDRLSSPRRSDGFVQVGDPNMVQERSSPCSRCHCLLSRPKLACFGSEPLSSRRDHAKDAESPHLQPHRIRSNVRCLVERFILSLRILSRFLLSAFYFTFQRPWRIDLFTVVSHFFSTPSYRSCQSSPRIASYRMEQTGMDRRGKEITIPATPPAGIACVAPRQTIVERMVFVKMRMGRSYGERAVPIKRGQVQAVLSSASVG